MAEPSPEGEAEESPTPPDHASPDATEAAPGGFRMAPIESPSQDSTDATEATIESSATVGPTVTMPAEFRPPSATQVPSRIDDGQAEPAVVTAADSGAASSAPIVTVPAEFRAPSATQLEAASARSPIPPILGFPSATMGPASATFLAPPSATAVVGPSSASVLHPPSGMMFDADVPRPSSPIPLGPASANLLPDTGAMASGANILPPLGQGDMDHTQFVEDEPAEEAEKQRRLEATREILQREVAKKENPPRLDERRKQLLRLMQEEAQEQMHSMQAEGIQSQEDDMQLMDTQAYAPAPWLDSSQKEQEPRPTLDANLLSAMIRQSGFEPSAGAEPAVSSHSVPGDDMSEHMLRSMLPLQPIASGSAAATPMPDPPSSSVSYFGPYTRQPGSKVPSSHASSLQQSTQSWQAGRRAGGTPVAGGVAKHQQVPQTTWDHFPVSREDVVDRKLAAMGSVVTEIRVMVEQAVQRGKVHPAELLQIMAAVRDMRSRTAGLSEEDLLKAGWPYEPLKRMRDLEEGFENWQQSEATAKGVLGDASGEASPAAVVEALSNLLVAWCRLGPLAEGPLCIDLDLQRRAQATMPLVEALLDQSMALARGALDTPPVQRLLVLLSRALEQPSLEGLGATAILSQSLHELHTELAEIQRRKAEEEPAQRMQAMKAAADQVPYLNAPERLWAAVTGGHLDIVETIIYQGALVSGQTRDQQGHSVFWDAVAFQQADVALLLLKHFTPGTPHGVDLSETHQRNGNCILHLISSIKEFSLSAVQLFTKVFNEMPEDMRLHRNARGQTFVHTAAGHINLWILKSAAQAGLFGGFSALDNAGWSPRRLLEYHLSTWKIAEEFPRPSLATAESYALPPWCRLPPAGSSESAFSDVALEVCDESSGGSAVRLPSHAVILAVISPDWHRELIEARKLGGAPAIITIDPQCCRSQVVVKHVLNFAHTGDVSCSFEGSGPLLWQLLCLCERYHLPDVLSLHAQDMLLRCLHDPMCGTIIPTLLRDGKDLRFSAAARQFIARSFISQDAAWHAAEADDRSTLLSEAIAELEPCFSQRAAERRSEEAMNATMGSISGSMAAMGQPLGSMTMASMAAMEQSGMMDSMRSQGMGMMDSIRSQGMGPMAPGSQAANGQDAMMGSMSAMPRVVVK